MTIKDTIKHLDELKAKEDGKKLWFTDSNFHNLKDLHVNAYGEAAAFILALHNAYEDLRRAALAGAELAEATGQLGLVCHYHDMEGCGLEESDDLKMWKEQRDAIVAAYHKACGDGKL